MCFQNTTPRLRVLRLGLGVALVGLVTALLGGGCASAEGPLPNEAPPPVCGNGRIEAGEQCDGLVPGGRDCLATTGHLDGELACRPDCTLDTSGCHTCGDGRLDPAEQCEPGQVPANACETLGRSGSAYCDGSCRIAGCYTCGDGVCSDRQGESAYNCVTDCGGWRDLSLGEAHSCAVTQTGTAYCWGADSAGQLGHGGRAAPATPEGVWRVQGLQGVAQLSAGGRHTCAVEDSGALWCWGSDAHGQLGDGAAAPGLVRPAPVPVTGLDDAVQVAAGAEHTCAVTAQGSVWCWGDNTLGQLGDGTTEGRPVPTRVTGLDGAVALSAGAAFTCAVRDDGALWCWGANDLGQLGLGDVDGPQQVGDTAYSARPRQVVGVAAVESVTLGRAHGCAVLRQRAGEHSRRALYCWGADHRGQLGPGAATATTARCSETPCRPWASRVDLDFQPLRAAAGDAHTCALLQDSHVWCWGAPDDGRLGRGAVDALEDSGDPADLAISAPPARVQVGRVSGVRRVAVGGAHGCAVTADRSLWCWGANVLDQAACAADVCWEPGVLFDRIVR